MNDTSIAQPRSKADILQIMAGLAMDAELIGEPVLSNYLMLGVEGAKLPWLVLKQLVNVGFDLVRSAMAWGRA